jgi:hypothetical protein
VAVGVGVGAEVHWLDVVIALVDNLRDDHCMGTVLICFLLDTFALPTPETLDALNVKLLKRARRRMWWRW